MDYLILKMLGMSFLLKGYEMLVARHLELSLHASNDFIIKILLFKVPFEKHILCFFVL
jgi:hypothetical protein